MQPGKAASSNKIPIRKPPSGEAERFEQLVAMVQAAKNVAQASRLPGSGSKRDACATFLEELIDACVLPASEAQIISEGHRAKPGSLYFPEEAAAKNLRFTDPVSGLLNVDDASSFVVPAPSANRSAATKQDASSTISAAEAFCSAANAPSHPLRQNLNRLSACNAQAGLETASPDLFAVIKQRGKV